MAEFGALNWSILGIYVIANLWLGFYLGKKIESAEDFFLGDRSIPWWAIGISVVVTLAADLDLAGFRAGYRWVAGCYLVAAIYLALAYPSGTAADRQRATVG